MKSRTANDVLIFREVRGHRPPLQPDDDMRQDWCVPYGEKRSEISSLGIAAVWLACGVVVAVAHYGVFETVKWLVGLVW